MGYSPWDHKELDTTEQLTHTHTHTHTHTEGTPIPSAHNSLAHVSFTALPNLMGPGIQSHTEGKQNPKYH